MGIAEREGFCKALSGPTVGPRLTSIPSSITSISPDRQGAAFVPFDRWGTQGPERLWDVPKVTQLVDQWSPWDVTAAGFSPEPKVSSLEATFHEPYGQRSLLRWKARRLGASASSRLMEVLHLENKNYFV